MTPKTLVTEFMIDWRAVKAVGLFASRDQVRFILNGVYVERRKNYVVLVATDGRRLAALKQDIDSENYSGPVNFLIPLFLISKMPCDRMEMRSMNVRLENGASIYGDTPFVTITDFNGFSVGSKGIEGKYPTWRMVLPSGPMKEEVVACLNAELLVDYQKAAKMLGSGTSKSVKLWQAGKLEPFIVETGIKDFTGVLMPTRGFTDIFPEPSPQIRTDHE